MPRKRYPEGCHTCALDQHLFDVLLNPCSPKVIVVSALPKGDDICH